MIALNLQTFQQSRENGNVTGVIFLELPNGAFPGRGWSDFPVIILGWWAEAMLQLEMPTRRKVQWLFMDGPYRVTLTKAAGGRSIGAFDLLQLHNSLIEVADHVVAHCEQHGMFSRDFETLRDNLQRLKANQTAQRTGVSRSACIDIRPSAAAGPRR